MTAFVVFVERALRKILVNYAKRQVGNKVYQGQSSHLPLKLNMAGVIPPIFASSIILFPATLASWFGQGDQMIWLRDLAQTLGPGQPVHEILYASAIIFFCFFYTALQYNPKETAENLEQGVGFRPFVYGLAVHLGLNGWVRNTSAGVDIEVDGTNDGYNSRSSIPSRANFPLWHASITLILLSGQLTALSVLKLFHPRR